jgi:hypothetical protein
VIGPFQKFYFTYEIPNNYPVDDFWGLRADAAGIPGKMQFNLRIPI